MIKIGYDKKIKKVKLQFGKRIFKLEPLVIYSLICMLEKALEQSDKDAPNYEKK